MNYDVSSTYYAAKSYRRAVAVLLVFLTLFVSTAIAVPALASLREDSSSFPDDELTVGLADQHFVLALYRPEAFAFFDESRVSKQMSLVVSRPYRAPPVHFLPSTI